jgi:hypothetical protein
MSKHMTAVKSRRPVLAATIALLSGALQGVTGAQLPPSDLVSVRSFSGQFIAYAGRSSRPAPGLLTLSTNQSFVQLEPTFATVSCERIKQLLLRELDSPAPWRGTIYLVLYPARTASDTITITSQRFKSSWQYRVDLPNVVERSRYVRAMVQVLLLELANRTAPARASEVPLWLIEGFSELLLASKEVEIILPPPRAAAYGLNVSTTSINARKETLLQQAQRKLRGRPPLTFEDLSWPADPDLTGDEGDRYRGSAQLFTGELLRLPDGRICLRNMLTQLPRHYNWQFAFLGAFHTRFERPLEVEKWWALLLTEANDRGLVQTWSLDESWQKLDQAVHSAVQIRTSTNEMPLRASVPVQKVIREWDPLRQTQALGNMLRELGLLRLRIAQEYVALVQDYTETIQTYLQERDRSASKFPFTRQAGRKRAVETAVQQLDALDALRETLRPSTGPIPGGRVPALPAPAT